MCQPPTLVKNAPSVREQDVGAHGAPTRATTLSRARRTLDRGTLLACLSLLLLITGMSITFPQLQSRRDALGCDALCYGSMTSVRSALSLVGTAAVGWLSDKNGSPLARTLGALGPGRTPSGRRACLLLGTLASLVGLAIAVSMNSLRGLWLSMIPGALLQHNFEVYKALLSEYHNDIEHLEAQGDADAKGEGDATPTPSRSGSVGKLGMAAGISFMIGPTIAAVTSPTFQVAAYFAIACTCLSGLLVFYLPLPVGSTHEPRQQRTSAQDTTPTPIKKTEFTLSNMVKLRTPKSRAAMFLLVVKLNMALAFHIFNTVWPASLKARFNFGPSDHAKFMSFVGISYAFSQGFLAKRLVELWGRDGKAFIIMACCAVLGVGRYIAYSTQSLVVVYAAFLCIINALGTVNTVITADTGAIAPRDEVGGLFGILEAAQSAAGMLGPFLGGVLAHYLGAEAPLLAVVGVYGVLFAVVSWGYERHVLSCSNDVATPQVHVSNRTEAKKSM